MKIANRIHLPIEGMTCASCVARCRERAKRCARICGVLDFRKLLVLLLLVVALPLRGYAALAADLCADHHGGAAAAHAGHQDPSSDHEHEAPDGPSATSSSCSHCASCSVGASVAPEAKQISLPIAGSDRIPFFDQHTSGYVPDHPERPPLVS